MARRYIDQIDPEHAKTPLEEVAVAFLRRHAASRGGDERQAKLDEWAFGRVTDVVQHDAEGGLRLARLMGRLAADDETRFTVVGGVIENLLKHHGTEILSRVEAAGRQDQKFRKSMAGVHLSSTDPVYPRFQQLMREFGFVRGR
jgi:hypothetical protein